jgi:hypothetical protein
MRIRLKDRIKFAITFFKALDESKESVMVEVVRNEDSIYLMTVTADHLNEGFDNRIYG